MTDGRTRATDAFDHPLTTAIIQSFNDHGRGQPQQLAEGLYASPAPISELMVNDDGGSARSAALWKAALHRPSDFYVSMPNVHEIRAYNRLASMARGQLLILLQGDNCLPNSTAWIARALELFKALPSLGLLGGSMGFDGMHHIGDNFRQGWGGAPLHRIPSWVTTASMGAVPFMYVGAVNIGPLIVRRDAFLRLGGFNESFSERGQLGIHLDLDLALRMWNGGYEVGLFYGGVGNGVNGRKSKRSAEMRVRPAPANSRTEHPTRHEFAPCSLQAERQQQQERNDVFLRPLFAELTRNGRLDRAQQRLERIPSEDIERISQPNGALAPLYDRCRSTNASTRLGGS